MDDGRRPVVDRHLRAPVPGVEQIDLTGLDDLRRLCPARPPDVDLGLHLVELLEGPIRVDRIDRLGVGGDTVRDERKLEGVEGVLVHRAHTRKILRVPEILPVLGRILAKRRVGAMHHYGGIHVVAGDVLASHVFRDLARVRPRSALRRHLFEVADVDEGLVRRLAEQGHVPSGILGLDHGPDHAGRLVRPLHSDGGDAGRLGERLVVGSAEARGEGAARIAYHDLAVVRGADDRGEPRDGDPDRGALDERAGPRGLDRDRDLLSGIF